MMPTQPQSSQQLARALNMVVARSSDLNPEEIISALDQVEDEFVRQAESNDLRLETRRRTAEWKFKLLSERDRPYDQVKPLYDGVRKLGFTNLETEGTIEIYFALYCGRQSRTEEARQHLQSLCSKLDAAALVEDLPVYRQLKSEANQALSNLRG